MTELEYHEVGRIQIDGAIQLYNEKNYICSITLAKAGEEFLGKHLGDEASSKKIRENLLPENEYLKRHLNRIAVFFKHGTDLELCEQEINIRQEAIQYILRGISNYLSYTMRLTPLMNEFAKDHTEEKIDELLREKDDLSDSSVIPVSSVVKNKNKEITINA